MCAPGEGLRVASGGIVYRFLATKAETNDKYSLFEATLRPGEGSPFHVHSREEEAFFVLDGEVAFYTEAERVPAGPGTFINASIGVVRGFRNETDRNARMLILVAPSGPHRHNDHWRTVRDYLLYMGLLMTSIRNAATRIVGTSLDRAELEATTSGLCDRYRRASLRTPIALHRLREVQKRFRSTFDHVDVLLSPAVAHSTPILGHLSPDQPFDSWFERLSAFDCYAPLNNISGTPAITLPLHRTRSGLPLASHFSANIGDERTLLELAFELEEAMPWARIDNQPQPIPAPDEVGSIDTGRDTARRPG
ncbi:cupin domain-containing protein [Nocardia otitidiscaviarum]|uniref:cupin domain-containing protein n=1 Tax=Nocardia otitidiscaviarum TaxID=1823 RepID=UPI001461523D|nr:cupin domain-containing protein [Nocardia otitidiscaviarum]